MMTNLESVNRIAIDLANEVARLRAALRKIRNSRTTTYETPYPCDDQAWWLADEALGAQG